MMMDIFITIDFKKIFEKYCLLFISIFILWSSGSFSEDTINCSRLYSKISTPTISNKISAEDIYNDENITIRVSETGAGFEISKLVMKKINKKLRNNIDEFISTYSREATDLRYNQKGILGNNYVSEERVRTQLIYEFEQLPSKDDKKRLAIVSTTLTGRMGGESWIGIKFQLDKTKKPIELIAKIKLHAGDSKKQRESLSEFVNNMVALLHGNLNRLNPLDEDTLSSIGKNVDIISLQLDNSQQVKTTIHKKDNYSLNEVNTVRPSRKELEEKILNESQDITDYKTREINLKGGLKGTIIEVGEDAPIVSDRILSAPFSGTVYQVKYVPNSKKILASDFTQIKKLLIDEYQKIQLPAESDFLKKFSYVRKVELDGEKKFLTMAIKGGQNSKNTVILKIEIPNNAEEEDLGKIGINFLYAFYKYPADPKKFMDSLLDGVSIPKLDLKEFEIQGEDFEQLKKSIIKLT